MRAARSLVAVTALLIATTAGAAPAHAATPGSATVSPANYATSSATWNGGPFLVPNATAATGNLTCNQVAVCDDFTLVVDVPAGYDAGNDLKVAVGWPASNADFDLYVYDSAGNEITEAATTADPEILTVPPVAGRYTVRVVPYNPLGQSYWAMAQLVAAGI